jgi:hypothetical protein
MYYKGLRNVERLREIYLKKKEEQHKTKNEE